jgi:hypothetical protein
MRILTLIIIIFALPTLISCSESTGDSRNNLVSVANDAAPASQRRPDTFVIQPEANPGDLSDLFTYHNKLTLNNDITFDVLGLGTQAVGNYLILKSDKSRSKYVSITGDKQGRIVHSVATDIDADHQIEVILFIKNMTDLKGKLIIHEIDSLNKHNNIMLPELTPDLAEGYQGRDTFYVQNNKIIREFPVFSKSATGSKAGTNKRHIEYVLKNNTLLPSSHGQSKK